MLGLGINVHLTADELPVPTATSLAVLRPDHTVGRAELMARVLANLGALYDRWEAGRDDELAAAYSACCDTLGRLVAVLQGDRSSVTGRAVDVDAHGRLRVEVAGRIEVFAAGDVTHLR